MTAEERIDKMDERVDDLAERVGKIEEDKVNAEKVAARGLTWKSGITIAVVSMVLMYFTYEILALKLLT